MVQDHLWLEIFEDDTAFVGGAGHVRFRPDEALAMSAYFGPDEIELSGLERLTKALKVQDPPVIHVGILENASRHGAESSYLMGIRLAKKASTKIKRILGISKLPSNADIGAVHEYGAPAKGIPSRSWLRMPLTDHLQEEMERQGLLGEEELSQVIASGSIMPWLKKVEVAALRTVKMAFFTQGWGKWQKWKSGYTSNTGMILQDTKQLIEHVDTEIVG
jgi:hypothetical protein